MIQRGLALVLLAAAIPAGCSGAQNPFSAAALKASAQQMQANLLSAPLVTTTKAQALAAANAQIAAANAQVAVANANLSKAIAARNLALGKIVPAKKVGTQPRQVALHQIYPKY